jgi:pyridinium-3,5-biscarboxylic acid mononucleotide sulfurtransferase
MDYREEISNEFKSVGFSYITLDLEGFRSGSMNEVLTKTKKG